MIGIRREREHDLVAGLARPLVARDVLDEPLGPSRLVRGSGIEVGTRNVDRGRQVTIFAPVSAAPVRIRRERRVLAGLPFGRVDDVGAGDDRLIGCVLRVHLLSPPRSNRAAKGPAGFSIMSSLRTETYCPSGWRRNNQP